MATYRTRCNNQSGLQVAFREAFAALPVPTSGEEELAMRAERAQTWRMFWGFHQLFFRSLCLAAKVPTLEQLVLDRLASGHSVVIGLQATGAHHSSCMGQHACSEDLPLTSAHLHVADNSMNVIFN
jgi:hypothetical protein